jgi:hypothetical protein
MVVERSLRHARESRVPMFGGLLPVTKIDGSSLGFAKTVVSTHMLPRGQ